VRFWLADPRQPEERERHYGALYRGAQVIEWLEEREAASDDLWGVGGVQFREGRPNPPRPTRVWR
jgi:hypothetical protein